MDYKLMLIENPVLFVHLLTDDLIDKDDSLIDYVSRKWVYGTSVFI